LELIFVEVRGRGLVCLLHVVEEALSPFAEAVFSPVYVFGFFVKEQMAVVVWFYFWVFHSVALIFVYLYHAVFGTMALKYNSKSSNVKLLGLLSSAIWGLLFFHMNFRIDFSISAKNDWNINGHCIESVGCFR
jgi:hypothetical protein